MGPYVYLSVGPEKYNMALLEVERLEAGYGEVRVLRGVSLEVGAGEFVALVGPNGAGKTTLLRAVSGLIPAWGGAIRLDGERIERLPPYRIAARGVATIPEGRRLFEELTVRENLDLGAYLRRGADAETLDLVERLFPVIRERAGQPAGLLSGGEQQMVAVARGLMARPRLLLMDDPFLGLAGSVIRRVSEALRELTDARGLAVLAAGQHVRRLLRLAHRAYLLEEGRIVLAGTGADLLGDPRLRRSLLELIPEGGAR